MVRYKLYIAVLLFLLILSGFVFASLLDGFFFKFEKFFGNNGKGTKIDVNKNLKIEPSFNRFVTNNVELTLKNAVNLNKNIKITRTKLPKNVVYLQNLLNEIETKNSFYKKSIETATTDLEKDRLIHLLSHERLNDKLNYVYKMNNIPKTLDETSALVVKIENGAKKLKIKGFDIKKIQSSTNIIKNKIPILKSFYNKRDYIKLQSEINGFRREALLSLMNLQKDMKTYNSMNLANTIKLNKDLIKILKFDYPYVLDEVGEPLTQEDVNVAVCIIKWNYEYPPSYKLGGWDFIGPIIKEYYSENSFNKVNMNFQEITLDGVYDPHLYNEGFQAIELCDPYINFSSVDIFVYPYTNVVGGTMGVSPYVTEEGEVSFAITSYIPTLWYEETGYPQDYWYITQAMTAIHEFGHNFGLPHANSLECESMSFSADAIDSCYNIEYGNLFDVMGRGYDGGHINGQYKTFLGWSKSKIILDDGTYDIGALETNENNFKLLRIPYLENPVCIEYRKPLGFDDFTDFPYFSSLYIFPSSGCLFVSVCRDMSTPLPNGDIPKNMLVDSTPNSRAWDFDDACIPPNTLFENEDLGLSVHFKPARGKKDVAKIIVDIDENRGFEQV